jgi:hypothetical protein
MTKMKAVLVTLFMIGCLVILLSSSWSEFSLIQFDKRPIVKPFNGSLSVLMHADELTKMFLRPGDLPGYTGWARPSNTVAGSFLSPHFDGIGTIQQPWTCAF